MCVLFVVYFKECRLCCIEEYCICRTFEWKGLILDLRNLQDSEFFKYYLVTVSVDFDLCDFLIIYYSILALNSRFLSSRWLSLHFRGPFA